MNHPEMMTLYAINNDLIEKMHCVCLRDDVIRRLLGLSPEMFRDLHPVILSIIDAAIKKEREKINVQK